MLKSNQNHGRPDEEVRGREGGDRGAHGVRQPGGRQPGGREQKSEGNVKKEQFVDFSAV